jgi:hypothetical protein
LNFVNIESVGNQECGLKSLRRTPTPKIIPDCIGIGMELFAPEPNKELVIGQRFCQRWERMSCKNGVSGNKDR